MTERELVLQGLEILRRGTEHSLFPDSFMGPLHEGLRYLVTMAGLAALKAVPPDDRIPNHAELEAQLRANLADLTGERG